MKKITLLLFVLLSNLLLATTPGQVVKQAIDKSLKTNYVSFNLIDKLKFVESGDFVTDTLYIIAKRNGFVPVINALVRIQYKNGNVNTFNGKEIKMLDVDEKRLFVADTSEGAINYLMGIGMNFYIMKHLASTQNKLDFKNYTFRFLNDTTLDNQLCYQVEIYAKINSTPNTGQEYKIVKDSVVLAISKADDLIRRYYRVVTLDDGREQVEDQLFTNIETGLPIDDLMFDISLPNGFKLTTPKSQKSKDESLLAIGSEAPKWVLGDENGKEYRLSQYLGKVVVLDFWGTWCKWCRKAMPKIQEIYEEFKDKDVVVFGISCQEPPNAKPKEYMNKVGAKYQLLVQGDEVANHYKIRGYPTLYIVDKYGKIAFSFVGYSDDMKAKLEEVINRELAR